MIISAEKVWLSWVCATKARLSHSSLHHSLAHPQDGYVSRSYKRAFRFKPRTVCEPEGVNMVWCVMMVRMLYTIFVLSYTKMSEGKWRWTQWWLWSALSYPEYAFVRYKTHRVMLLKQNNRRQDDYYYCFPLKEHVLKCFIPVIPTV